MKRSPGGRRARAAPVFSLRRAGSWTQSYTDDSLNRLVSAAEGGTGGWSEGYGYDAYGNRWVINPVGLPALTLETPVAQSWYNGNNQISTWGYDAAGNVKQVGSMTRSFTYDIENRQVTATVSGQATSYAYDGDGRRVKKVAPSGVTTVYVYDEQGQLTAEYATGAATSSPCRTCYLTADPLGSTRLVTDAGGNCVARHDDLPFGEEIVSGNRTTSLCFGGSDGVTEKFTGKERDAETGLDYFGARYFSGAQGRFTSPDWSAKPQPVPYANLSDPQTLNLYAYVRNNPLSRIDPDGHFDCTGKNAQGVGCQYIANWNAEHGITPTAPKSAAPGVPVTLPNGKTVPDRYAAGGVLLAPVSDLRPVANAGKELKQMVTTTAMADGYFASLGTLAVGLATSLAQNGDFDYQRVTFVKGKLQQLPQFRDVANFDVGLMAQQAGLSLDDVLTIAGQYAKRNSSNYRPNEPYGLDPQTRALTEQGYQVGASGVYDK